MKTLIIASALALGLTGAVLAAPPVAPPPRPVGPQAVAPKVNDTFEVLVFAAQRPVRVRVAVLAGGKPVGESWLAWQRKMFDFCDRDGDGALSESELRFVFGEQGRAQVLAGGVYQINPAKPPALAKYDTNGDGKVTFDEFAANYSLAGMQLVRPLAVQPDVNNNAAITEAVFRLLDADNDGKLTKAEVRAVERLLASRDADEDECLSVAELAPNVFNPNAGRRLGQAGNVTPNGGPYPAPVGAQMVHLFETGRVPGTVTQQVIKKYDKNNDFELTQSEIGFDDTFRALDKDGNGRLDGEELDAWRTGSPDLDVTLSLSPKPADCFAKLADPKSAEARGFKMKQSESGRLVLHVGRQTVDLGVTAALGGFATLKQQYGALFTQAAGGKDHILEKDLAGPNAVQFQFVRVLFDAADRNADGKLTRAEYDAYFDLQDDLRNIGLSLTPSVQTPSLFDLLDENRDGRLSVRELRTAWDRLLVLEEPGAEALTRGIIQPSVTVRLSRAFDRGGAVAVPPVAFRGVAMPAALVPTKGPLWFRKMDRNGDGDVSRAEYLGTKAEFDAIDTDGDDLISLQEAEAWDKKAREK